MFRPSKEVEVSVRKAYEAEIYEKFEIGTFHEKDIVGEILKAGFSYYESLLSTYLEKSASIDMLAFILSEYDGYLELSLKHKKNELEEEESSFWVEYGSKSKRAIKYLAEKIVCHLPNEVSRDLDHVEALSYCWIAAEEMVSLYMIREVSYSLFPEDCYVIISERTNYNFIEFKCDKLEKAIGEMNVNDFIRKSTNQEIFPFDYHKQNDFLGEAFKNHFKLDYSTTLGLIQHLINAFEENGSDIRSFRFVKNNMVAALSEDFQKYDVNKDIVLNILSGFSLSKNNLTKRVLYKPKQEYRAFGRSLFEIETENGCEILFSKRMASEELTQLIVSVCFRKLPKEWIDLGPDVKKSLDKLSNYAGSWFESFLLSFLNERKVQHVKSLKKIKVDGKTEFIPDGVGEIDIIAIVGESLHLIECKMVQFSSEPTRYVDDVVKFTRGEKSYAQKFRRKINWVKENFGKIIKHLENVGVDVKNVKEVKPYMVTYYPTIAASLINDFVCLDHLDYIENHYKSGKEEFLAPPPHNTLRAAPHRASP